jgi:hypothetical protein
MGLCLGVVTRMMALTLAPVLQANLLARPALPPAQGARVVSAQGGCFCSVVSALGGWQLRLRGGENDLHSAVLTGSVFAVEGLIGEGADVDAPNGAGLSALHLAAEARRLGVAALLVAKGADVNVCDGAERTPLHHAAARGHRGTIMVLLDLGADLAAADERGWTPLHEAAAAHQVPPLSAAFLFCISDRPHFQLLTGCTSPPVWQVGALEVLLEAGANALATDLLGRTPLLVCHYDDNAKHGKGTWGGSTFAHDALSAGAPSLPASADTGAAIKALLETAMKKARASAAGAGARGLGPPALVDAVGGIGQMEEVLTADERLQLSNLTEHVRKQLFGRSVAEGASTPPDAAGDSSEQGSIYLSMEEEAEEE